MSENRDKQVYLCGCYLVFGSLQNIENARALVFDSKDWEKKSIKCPYCNGETFLDYKLKVIYHTITSKKLFVIPDVVIEQALNGNLEKLREIYEKRGDHVGRGKERRN